jgi:hypothetical protein
MTANPSGYLRWRIRVRIMAPHGGGGMGSPACRGWVAVVVYRLPNLAQTITRDDVLLTEAGIGRRRRAEASLVTAGGRSWYSARGRVVAGVPSAC